MSSARILPHAPPALGMRPGAPCLHCSVSNDFQNNNPNNKNRIKPHRLACSFLTGEGEIPGKCVIILLRFCFGLFVLVFLYLFFF